jgi:hypothetical protein
MSLAVIVLSFSVLFPPWLYQCEWRSFSAGYHFFVKSPMVDALCISSDPLSGPPPSVRMNIHRLVWQSIVVIVLSIGLVLILKLPRTNLSVVTAVLIIGVGAVASMYLGLIIQFER